MAEKGLEKWLEKALSESGIPLPVLVEGICEAQYLHDLWNREENCPHLLFVILWQRLGYSPDKLEYILSWQDYRMECIWDAFQVAVFRGRKKSAERLLALYRMNPASIEGMYQNRGRAMVAYWIDHDLAAAEKYLMQALDETFPRWNDKQWTDCCISTTELENALALVRVRREQQKPETGLFPRCGKYIKEHVTDKEEYAKIYCKYAWMAAEDYVYAGKAAEAISMCTKAVQELCYYGMEYFVIPLLKRMLFCYERLKFQEKAKDTLAFGEDIARKMEGWISVGHCKRYLQILEHIHGQYQEAWYPEDSILWGCCQKMYHLDYEILFAERQAWGMTQAEAAEGIYKSPKEIGRIEQGEVKPNRKRYALLMKKYQFCGERRVSYINAASKELWEWHRNVQIYMSRHQYDTVKLILHEMGKKLDMNQMENWRTLRFFQNTIAMHDRTRPPEEILEEDLQLLAQTWHISLEGMGEQAALSPKRRKKNGKDRGKYRDKYLYRPPLKIEALLLNQIATLLQKTGRKEEAEKLYEGVLRIMEGSRVGRQYQFYSYVLLLDNMAKAKCSVEDAGKAIQVSLRCGKWGAMVGGYLTIAYAMLDDDANKEVCRQMIREAYDLFELLDNRKNMRVLEESFREEFGEDIKKIN